MSHSCFLDIYGYRAEIVCESQDVLASIREDFAFFSQTVPAPAEALSVRIELFDEDPPFERVKDADAPVFTPRNVSFRNAGRTILDYSGRALGIHNPDQRLFQVFSRSTDLLYECTYLFLLSKSGEFFDVHHRHRVHALCVSIQQKAALVLLPMGGGKSTLGSELLRFPDVELLSDDSPLIDRRGDVWAFPLRIGLLPGFEGDIPSAQLRTVQRMEFGPKLLVHYAHFADRVVPRAEPCLLYIGSRSLRDSCEISPASKASAVKAMLANCVVGIGLFQGMEFVFQRGGAEIFRKAVTAFSRFQASLRLIARSEICHLTLGRDRAINARTVAEHLRLRAHRNSSDTQ